MIRRLSVGTVLAAAAAMLAGCASGQAAGGAMRTTGAGSSGASSTEWRSLIDPGLTAWRSFRGQAVPAGWRAENGVLYKDTVADDLISRDDFGDFELAFDWKLTPGGNSGVFYRATEEYDRVYWSGPEYQLLDDAGHADGRNPLTSAAAAYAIYAPPRGVVKPAGEWNSSRIVARGTHVEHWLNGRKVVDYNLGSDDWRARVAASKFHEYPDYGLAPRGHVGIQGDHTGALAIRDLRVRVLR
ncbi:MAG TPA: DUF1080 domain-containing protein [Gemmatimonadaceae bacterium]